MNINENNNGNHLPSVRFILPTPSSSDESECESMIPSESEYTKLVVAYPPPQASPLDPPSHPNLAIASVAANAGIPLLAADAGVFLADEAVVSLAANAGVASSSSVSTIPPATYNLDGFALHLKNNNKKSVQYWCNERRNKNGN